MALFVATFTFFERNRRGRTESVVLAQFAGGKNGQFLGGISVFLTA